MSEGTVQIPVGRRRIIKRPRLIRLLDGANARLVLLVAPAGYGKTTLARQWLAEGRRQHAWYTATVPSADVSALALGLARVLDTIVPGPAERMRQRLLAVPASEDEPEVVAEILADSASAWPDDAWLVVDDYHHVGVSANADRFFARFAQVSGIRLLLTSRTHPSWVTAKHTTYGQVAVVDTGELALTESESAAVLGVKRDESLAALLETTHGWPVVIGLAAVTRNSSTIEVPSIEALYDFLAEEVFSAASAETRALLCRLAFVSEPTLDLARRLADDHDVDELLREAERLNLIERERTELRLHPLLRDFLKARFREYPLKEREDAIVDLTKHLKAACAWDDLFELLTQSPVPAHLDALIGSALRGLVATGRLGTLAAWCDFAEQQRIETPALQLAAAELNLTRGNAQVALPLAEGVAQALGSGLAARAWIVAGRSAYFLDRYDKAVDHFTMASQAARVEDDRLEASWGRFIATKVTKDLDAELALAALEPTARAGIDGILRYANGRLTLAERNGNAKDLLDEVLALVPLADRARNVGIKTSFLNAVGRALVERARYDEALAILLRMATIAEEIGLRVVLPDVWVGIALAEQGLRRFRRASMYCTKAESESRACEDAHNLVECQLLRMRMLISVGAFAEAVTIADDSGRQPGSILCGERAATRALAYACAGDFANAERLLEQATSHVDVQQNRALRAITNLVIAMGRGRPPREPCEAILRLVDESGSVDHLVTAVRGIPAMVPVLCSTPRLEPILVGALNRSRDFGILSSYGLRADRTSPGDSSGPFLSAREEDVLVLLCQGLSNRAIARTLFISDVTVKVHLRHIYRKLGVRNRLQAVAYSNRLPEQDAP